MFIFFNFLSYLVIVDTYFVTGLIYILMEFRFNLVWVCWDWEGGDWVGWFGRNGCLRFRAVGGICTYALWNFLRVANFNGEWRGVCVFQ